MKWSRVIFDNAKTHFVPTRLKQAVIDDLLRRGCQLSTRDRPGWPVEDDVKEIGIDAGGFTLALMPWVRVPMGGVDVAFAADQLGGYLEELKRLRPRHELGEPTYKMHGAHQCIVLLPQQRTALIRAMTGYEERADFAYASCMSNWRLRHVVNTAEIPKTPIIYWVSRDIGRGWTCFSLERNRAIEGELAEEAERLIETTWLDRRVLPLFEGLLPLMETRHGVRGFTEYDDGDLHGVVVEFHRYRDSVEFINELYNRFYFPHLI